jgi:hypothetical protein
MNKASKGYSLRIITPSVLFILMVVIFNIIPSIIIVLTDYIPVRELLSEYDFKKSKEFYFYALWLFFVSFLIGRLVISLAIDGKFKVFSRYKASKAKVRGYFQVVNGVMLTTFMFCMLFIILYAVNGGIEKMLLLGSDIDSSEFRFMGFNEIHRFYTAGLAIARRFLLPVIIVVLYLRFRYGDSKVKAWLIFSIALQLFASSLTFARAPFLTLLVAIFTVKIITEKNKKRMIFQLFILFFSVLIVAGSVTALQYNLTDMPLGDILNMGIDFITNRAWFVPNVVPINLVFSDEVIHSNPLFLQYSRLGGLFGGEVIGTLQDLSKYVAPVGYIGDIWRNFSWIGLVLFGIFFSMLFAHLDALSAGISMIGVIIFIFLILAMILYWIMGVVFSQGAVFSIFLVYFFIYIDRFFQKKISNI